jgi:hypothetical protein
MAGRPARQWLDATCGKVRLRARKPAKAFVEAKARRRAAIAKRRVYPSVADVVPEPRDPVALPFGTSPQHNWVVTMTNADIKLRLHEEILNVYYRSAATTRRGSSRWSASPSGWLRRADCWERVSDGFSALWLCKRLDLTGSSRESDRPVPELPSESTLFGGRESV